jgi:hypothetical protein
VGIVPECDHQLLMDLCRFPSFQLEKLEDKSLFLFLHLWSLMDFVKYPNWSKPVSLSDFLSGNRLSQFTSHSYALCHSRLGSLWEVERIEMGEGPGTFWTRVLFWSAGPFNGEIFLATDSPSRPDSDLVWLRNCQPVTEFVDTIRLRNVWEAFGKCKSGKMLRIFEKGKISVHWSLDYEDNFYERF